MVLTDPFISPAQTGGNMLGPWFTTDKDVECDGCGVNISPGDPLRADGEGGYMCMDCGKD